MIDREDIEEFVRQSNAIEGLYATPGDPLYDDHLNAALWVAETPTWGRSEPPLLHSIVMRSKPLVMPGFYRKVDVSVGGYVKAPWLTAPDLMADLLWRADYPDSEGVEAWCWAMHNELEAIHPFMDGNGRTGRLWLNALRLQNGLPWLIVWERDRQAYYQRIIDWERDNA